MAVLRRAALGAALAAAGAVAQAATATTEPLARLETGMHTAVIMRVATDSAGRWAVTASQDRTARVWELATGRLAGVLRPPQDDDNEGKLFAAALSPRVVSRPRSAPLAASNRRRPPLPCMLAASQRPSGE